ncbi:MAG: hypothetical protein Roseis2KO_29890 [Roseivirga sp.]
MTDPLDFIERTRSKVFFYIESNIWSGIDHNRLNNWLSLFKNTSSQEEEYLAYTLLDKLVYYNKKDCLKLIESGIYDLVVKDQVSLADEMAFFKAPEGRLNSLSKDLMSKLGFMTLTSIDESETTASSRVIARYLVHDLGIPERNIFDPEHLELALKKFDTIILIDDFIGSGSQIINFWYYQDVPFKKSVEKIGRLCLDEEVKIKYLCIVASKQGISNFYGHGEMNNLVIHPCELIDESHDAFGPSSDSFESEDDRIKYKRIFDQVCKRNDIKSVGYDKNSFTIAFEHTIPDSSLPIFWQKRDTHLIRNKRTGKNE